MSKSWTVFVIVSIHMVSICLSLVINRHIWLKTRKTPQLKQYMLLQAIFLIWMVAKVMKTLSPTVELRWAFVVLQYVGSSFPGVMLFHFSWTFFYSRAMPVWLAFLTWTPFVAYFVLVVTNPFHHLVYTTFLLEYSLRGPASQLHSYATWLLMGVGLLLCLIAWFRDTRLRSRSAVLLLSGAITIPMVFNALYITNLYPLVFGSKAIFDYTPICAMVSLLLFAIAIFQGTMFEYGIFPVDRVYASMPPCILIVGGDGEIRDMNRDLFTGEGLKWEEQPDREALKRFIPTLTPLLKRIGVFLAESDGTKVQESFLLGDKEYRLTLLRPDGKKGSSELCLAILSDNQHGLNLLRSVSAARRELAVLEFRLQQVRKAHAESKVLTKTNEVACERLERFEQDLSALADWFGREVAAVRDAGHSTHNRMKEGKALLRNAAVKAGLHEDG